MYIQESLSTRYFDRRTEYKAPMVEHQRVWKNKFNWSLHCVQLCNRMNERGECARIGGRISLLPRFPSFGWYKQRSSSACCVTSCLSVSHAGKRRGGEMCVCVCVLDCWRANTHPMCNFAHWLPVGPMTTFSYRPGASLLLFCSCSHSSMQLAAWASQPMVTS